MKRWPYNSGRLYASSIGICGRRISIHAKACIPVILIFLKKPLGYMSDV